MKTFSSYRLASYIALALFAAVMVLVIAVFPAEFGKDPTGLGHYFGLTKLATQKAPLTIDSSTPGESVIVTETEFGERIITVNAVGDVDLATLQFDNGDTLQMSDQVIKHHETGYRTDKRSFTLGWNEKMEFKAILRKDQVLLYSWIASDNIYTDFHGHPEDGSAQQALYPENFSVRYSESEGSQDAGSIVAGLDGEHGWYWQNISETPVTIELYLSGYYSDLKLIELSQ